jgi:hypothetical protein
MVAKRSLDVTDKSAAAEEDPVNFATHCGQARLQSCAGLLCSSQAAYDTSGILQ